MRDSPLLAIAVVAVLIAGAYGGSLRNDFVHDDGLFMEDPRVQSLAEMPRLLRESRWGFNEDPDSGRVHQYYRPLEPIPYVAAHFLNDGKPAISHAMSLLLHALNAWLVLILLRRWTGAGWPSACGVAIFALHPAYSEAVLWPAALGGLGAFACTWALFHLNVGSRWRWWVWPASALLYFLALLFKETGVLAPAFVLLGWLLLERPRVTAALLRFSAFAPALLSYGVMRRHALGSAVPRFDHVPFTVYELAINGLALLPTFARTLSFPYPLSFHHDFDPVSSVSSPAVLLGAGILVLVATAVLASRRKNPPLAFGLSAAALATLPYVVLHKPADNVFAERYLYDLGPGIALCLTALIASTARQSPAVRSFVALLCVAGLGLFVQIDRERTVQWRTEERLFRDTLEKSRRAEIIRVNLAVRFLREHRYDEGIALLEDLIAFAPDYRGAAYNLALLYHGAGRTQDAVTAMERAVRLDPLDDKAWLNLGYFYDEIGRREDSLITYFRLVERKPGYSPAWYNLAAVALEEGQLANARVALEVVLAANPDDTAARAMLRRAQKPGATAPRHPQETFERCERARRALQDGRPREAIARLRAAAWLDQAAPLPHQYLANVYALRGDREMALRHQQEALRLDPGSELYRHNLEALRAASEAEPTGGADGDVKTSPEG